jgi:hypothetical protein
MMILAIDPGPTKSAHVEWDGRRPGCFGIAENDELLKMLKCDYYAAFHSMVIERIQCYGMPVGESIFETVFWSGRFYEAWGHECVRYPRKDVKMNLCNTMRARDSNITQALVDRFAPLTKNHGKGKKSNPGFFYGFKKDIWQAFALAVTYYDTLSLDKPT